MGISICNWEVDTCVDSMGEIVQEDIEDRIKDRQHKYQYLQWKE